MTRYPESTSVTRARNSNAISREMYATDLAINNTVEGMPFRDAYRKAKETLGGSEEISPEDSLAMRMSPGASGDLKLGRIREYLSSGIERLRSFETGSE